MRIGNSLHDLIVFSGNENQVAENTQVPDKFYQARLNMLTGMLRGIQSPSTCPRIWRMAGLISMNSPELSSRTCQA